MMSSALDALAPASQPILTHPTDTLPTKPSLLTSLTTAPVQPAESPTNKQESELADHLLVDVESPHLIKRCPTLTGWIYR